MSILIKTRDWYGRFERPISSLSLIGGFLFDILTLHRVDEFWENVWIIGHIVIVAVCIVWIHARERGKGDEADPSKIHFWLVNTLQFFFGGLLSTYLVFYFRSAALSVSWPFLLILTVAFIANETFKRHYVRLMFQLSLFYLSLFSFAIFIVPVVVHSLGVWTFLFSGVVSLLLMVGFVAILRRFSRREVESNKKGIAVAILGVFFIINLFYFTNLIPPIPLSLKDAGVFHSISRDGNGDYLVTHEPRGWKKIFTVFENVHIQPNDTVYVYSAVFSPASLNTTIRHELEYFDPQTARWVSKGRANLLLIGGRDGGFRTYSEWSGLPAGDWRVNVENERGQKIGIIRFSVVLVNVPAAVAVEVKK